jgi:catechol 2,3-dioxygenase-like lactoylglutathione lyase family enzyme
MLKAVQPVLMSRDVGASVRFYERLGFSVTFRDSPLDPRYAAVVRDGCELHLQWQGEDQWAHHGDRPTYRFVVRDVDDLYAEFRGNGVLQELEPVPSPWRAPGDTPWGTREFHVRDPDGNGLQFYRPLSPDARNASAVSFEGGNPIFRVESVPASTDYYVGVLGFELEWSVSGVACVSRGRFHLFLCEGDQGNPGAWAWVGVSDARRLHDEYRAAGARVRHPPTNYDWACEMQVEDLDGNVLRMGSEPDPSQPVGDWLDMRGQTWRRSADGAWTRVGSA